MASNMPPTILDALNPEQRQLVITMITQILQEHQGPTPEALRRIRDQFLSGLSIQLNEDDLRHIVQVVQQMYMAGAAPQPHHASDPSATAPPPPPPAPQPHNPAHGGGAGAGLMNLEGMDPEDQVAALMDLLYMYRETDDPGVVPPMLDHQIVLLLHSVLSMAHNRPLARRVHRQLSQMNARAEETGANEGYGQAVRVVELVYNVIVGEAPRDAYNTQSTVGSGARTAILQAFMDQGVYARPEPFPGFEATPCQRFSAPVCDEAGNVLTAMDGRQEFGIIRNSSTGTCYTLTKRLKKCIYGSVQLAQQVAFMEGAAQPAPTGFLAGIMGGMRGGNAAGGRFVMTSHRVAVKCIEKRKIASMQRQHQASGRPLNENPLKEVACMQFITTRMSGTVAAPGMRGDPSRVLPMVDCIQDEEHIYLIMPCLEEEMFTVVETQSGPFPEPKAFEFLKQILDGMEVLHSLGLVHHDMSLENLMVDSQGGCVIIDCGMMVRVPLPSCGLAVKLAPEKGWPCRCGKPLYLAPEILQADRSFDPFKLDIWAVGIMMFILLSGWPPWDVVTGPVPTDPRFRLVISGNIRRLLDHWQIQMSDAAVDLLQGLLRGDPAQRPTIDQIRAHPWYQRGGQPGPN